MTTHKQIDRICCVVMVLAMLITVLFMNGEALGIQAADRVMGYEQRLFAADTVHTIDIVMDDWDTFLTTCQSEEYSMCNLVIDGEAYKNVGIRGKGNTSLTTVASMDSDRYSFKIEFDQYDSTKSYYGLDKLCLNNIIQDTTYMKDFLVYQMMAEFGVDAPLCSYVYVTVNGEDWGLYLAVEGIEDGFLQRNYGSDSGELYKPDSLSMGGGRGNGMDFNMDDFDFSQMELPDGVELPDGMENFMNFGGFGETGTQENDSEEANMPQGGMNQGGTMQPQQGGMSQGGTMQPPQGEMNQGEDAENGFSGFENFGNMDFGNKENSGMSFGMGSDDVKLQYIDEDVSSYSNIFDNAKTDVTEADQKRLIASLKSLSEYENLEEILDIDEVLRYFVVHNFVVNGDSYTGSMIHNYYLYEKDGQLSMIPWDYNLAFGTFQGNNADSAVNDPIDSPVSGGAEDRPMVNWIFESEEYTELYHTYFAEFLKQFFESGWLTELIDSTKELIAPYVEKDPTKFYSFEEFETGVATLREFCLLRAESVSGQLDGTIPSTSEGQSADSSALVDASAITLSDMGTMNNGMDGGDFQPGSFGGFENFGSLESFGETEDGSNFGNPDAFGNFNNSDTEQPELGDMELPEGMQQPDMGSMGQSQAGMQRPDADNAGQNGSMQRPDGGVMQQPGAENTASSQNTVIVLCAASIVCLLAGLLVAFKYKR